MTLALTGAGFMLENTSWGEGDSRTIQFLIPKVNATLNTVVILGMVLVMAEA